MTAQQLISQAAKGAAPAATLLIGPEAYERRRIKQALLAAFPEGAITSHDLSEISLAEALDDARSLSLFASERLIWIVNAEAALPRGKAIADEAEEEGGTGDAAPLAAYMKDPTPGVAIVFEASRFGNDGDDKKKQDRVRKFYAAIPNLVELRPFESHEARREAESLASRAGFRIAEDAMDLLVEAMAADIARIAIEIEKLALYAGGRTVTVDDITALVPDARATTIFILVNALGRRDRARALEALDTLTREGEYLPLALAFLATQFRLALAAREAGLKSGGQIQSHFTRLGIPMWGSRADQVSQTAAKFSQPQLTRALKLIYEADRGLRDARPDDRVVMERFILQLVA